MNGPHDGTGSDVRLRVGILSAVRHAADYVALLADDRRVELVGVAEEAVAPAWMRRDSASVAAAAGLPFDDADGALERLCAASDLVVVCSEPVRHASLATRALETGVHVLVDKPVAVTPDEVADLADAATSARGRLFVVNRRHSDAFNRVRTWIDAGHIGLPLHLDVEWFASGAHFSTSVERPELVTDPGLSGGGELLNFLLYPVDAVRHLTGLEIVEVYAEASTLFGDAHRASGVEDTAVVSLLLENAVTATITIGRTPAAPGLGPVSSSVRVLGSRGHAVADDDKPALAIHGTDGGVRAQPVGGPGSIRIVRRYLDEVVTTALATPPATGPRSGHSDGPAGYGIDDAAASLVVVDAAVRSARSGRLIILADERRPS